jgi:hypothetical protein
MLELAVCTLEDDVVPIEPAATLRYANKEREEDCPAEGLVLADVLLGVSLREDPCRGLVLQRCERLARVVPETEAVRAGFHERPDERPVLVERRPVGA